MCPHCEGLNPAFHEGRTAVLFKGPARALVIELKYHRGLFVLEDMAAIFRRSPPLLEHVRGATLVPVPLHPRKLRERGYNQAALLADILAREAGGGTRVEGLLRRVFDSESQTAFDRRTRMANLKNAFALARGAALTPEHHYILVDDVFTTGSTLNSCARALRRAGGLKLDVVTFGHG
jgi:ComF family protein